MVGIRLAVAALWKMEAGDGATSVEEAWAQVVADAGVKPASLKTGPSQFAPFAALSFPSNGGDRSWWSLLRCLKGELSPVCAIAGGILAQEAIKVGPPSHFPVRKSTKDLRVAVLVLVKGVSEN